MTHADPRYATALDIIIYIKAGSGYQLVANYRLQTSLRPPENIITERIHLLTDGKLYVLSGYWWDGVSGPVIDRKSNMRAGCSHDALYELMRKQRLPHCHWPEADVVYANVLLADKGWPIVAKIDLIGLKLAKGRAALPKNRRKRYTAGHLNSGD